MRILKKSNELGRARENAGDQVVFGSSFVRRNARTKHSRITIDTQLKISLFYP